MFTVYCPSHDADVLIWPTGVDAIANRDGVIAVAYHCTCGHRGVWVTGRGVAPAGDRPAGDKAAAAL